MLATTGPNKGKMVPVNNICAFVITPFKKEFKKHIVFAKKTYDGHFKEEFIDIAMKIIEDLKKYNIIVKNICCDGDSSTDKYKHNDFIKMKEKFDMGKIDPYFLCEDGLWIPDPNHLLHNSKYRIVNKPI